MRAGILNGIMKSTSFFYIEKKKPNCEQCLHEEIHAGLGHWATLHSAARSIFGGIWLYSAQDLQHHKFFSFGGSFFLSVLNETALTD